MERSTMLSMGKSTISMAIFKFANCWHNQRVVAIFKANHTIPWSHDPTIPPLFSKNLRGWSHEDWYPILSTTRSMPKLLAFIQYLRSLAVHFIFPHFFSTWVQMFISSSKLRKCLLFSMAPRFRGEARTAYPRRLGVRCSSFCTSCCSSSSSWKDNGTNNGNATKKFMGFWICVSIYYIIIYIYMIIYSALIIELRFMMKI